MHAKTDNFFADAPEALRFLRTRAAELAAGRAAIRRPGERRDQRAPRHVTRRV